MVFQYKYLLAPFVLTYKWMKKAINSIYVEEIFAWKKYGKSMSPYLPKMALFSSSTKVSVLDVFLSRISILQYLIISKARNLPEPKPPYCD